MGLRKKKSLVEQVVDQASDYVDTMKPHVEAARDSARVFVQDTALPALADAREKAGPRIAEAREKAGPVVADARTRAATGIADAKTKATPVVAAGAAAAAKKAADAKSAADTKIATLKGEPPKKQKKSTLKRLVLVAGLAGGVAFVAKKLQGDSTSDNWQSSYTPSPAPSTPAAPSSPSVPPPATDADDSAGATPGEAVADAAEAPHPVTSPDQPAEVVEIDPDANRP